MLWVAPRVLCVLGGYFTTELHPDPHVAARVKDMCGMGKWIAGNGWDKRSLLGPVLSQDRCEHLPLGFAEVSKC